VHRSRGPSESKETSLKRASDTHLGLRISPFGCNEVAANTRKWKAELGEDAARVINEIELQAFDESDKRARHTAVPPPHARQPHRIALYECDRVRFLRLFL